VYAKGYDMELSVEISRMKPGVITLSLIGPIDENSSSTLDKEICEALAEPVEILVLDMAGVDYIASSGVGTIVKAKTSLKRRGGNLVIINLQPQVEKVFEIIRLIPIMEVFASREELDEYLVKVQHKIKREDD
jgi:anti-anti-sigma factor